MTIAWNCREISIEYELFIFRPLIRIILLRKNYNELINNVIILYQ